MGKRTPQHPPAVNQDAVDSETRITEADIDETLKETFPASDPSSWTLGSTRKQNPETISPQTGTPDEPAEGSESR